MAKSRRRKRQIAATAPKVAARALMTSTQPSGKIKFGTAEIGQIKFGTANIAKVYFGSQLICQFA